MSSSFEAWRGIDYAEEAIAAGEFLARKALAEDFAYWQQHVEDQPVTE